MPAFDLPLDELQELRLLEPPPTDLAEFWLATLADARSHQLLEDHQVVENRLVLSRTYDLTFHGFQGQPVKAWLQVPADATGPLPAVVEFHGYSTTRPVPLASTFVEAGYAHLHLDSRGQGWWSASMHPITADRDAAAGEASWPGLMTRGVGSPETYYFRRLVTDAVRLVELAMGLAEVDASRVFVHGKSQGGGVAIATAGLCELGGLPVAGAMPDVPFLCSFRRAVDVAAEGPYLEIEEFLRARPAQDEAVFNTLRYFDAVHLAPYASCPALFSVGLRDMVCPPSTVYQAFNAWGGPKQMEVHRWNQHEGGRDLQTWRQLEWLAGGPGRAR